MAAVAVKAARAGVKSVKRHSGRRPRSRILGSKLAKFVLGVFALALVFAYVNEYASLKLHGYSRSKLLETRQQEQVINEQLKVELLELGSPQQVVSRAREAGLVYSTQYDYLQSPKVLVSAGEED